MRAAQLNISLLGVVVVAIGIPAAFHLQNGRAWTEPPEGIELEQILMISRGLAIMLLFLYLVYLVLSVCPSLFSLSTLALTPSSPIAALQPAVHARVPLQDGDAVPASPARGRHAPRRTVTAVVACLPPADLGALAFWLELVRLDLVRRFGPLAPPFGRRHRGWTAQHRRP